MQDSLRILFAGSGEFGLPTLKALREAGGQIVQIYSQPDRPAGRGRALTPTPVSQYALDESLPLVRTADLNTEPLPAADVLVVIAFGQKISERVAAHCRLGSVNLHASLLPKYRGAAPIHWAILRGETVTGNSVIRLANRMDAGAVLGQSRVEIDDTETTGELHDRLALDGAPLVLKVLRELAAGRAIETPQDESLATTAPKLSRETAVVDWSKPADAVARHVRGLFPWPGCVVKLLRSNGEEVARLTLVRAKPVLGTHAQPGVIGADGSVGAGDGAVQILEVQPVGKRPMALADFRNGRPWEPGMRLEETLTARDLALFDLDRTRLPGWPPNELRPPNRPTPSDPRDLGLAEQIFVGVVKNHLLLQQLAERYSGRKLKSIDPLVQKILSVGLYQLHFLDRVPASAAVNEAVEQAKRFGRSKAAGFVNAVLRKAGRGEDFQAEISDPSILFSHPRELMKRLEKLLGPADARRFCEHDNREPPTIVRASPGVSASPLESAGVSVTPHERPGMFVVFPAKKAMLAEWSRLNLAQVQDPTAAAVAEQCAIEPGQFVLDRCAGVGTKTMQLCEKVGDPGEVVAIDPSADRCEMLRSLLRQRGVQNVTVLEAAMLEAVPELAGRQFDVALLDVPCGNSGVLARRPEARYAQTDLALQSLSRLQTAILDDTAPFVRPGGRLVYSTCSVWPEENQGQVARFLKRHAEYHLDREHATLPSFSPEPAEYHDGGYWAVLRRDA